LTATEKLKIRAHLDFPVIDGRTALALGMPVNTQTSFQVDSAVERVLPPAVPLVRRYLNMCECAEAEIAKHMKTGLTVASVTGAQLRPGDKLRELQGLYGDWQRKLAVVLGVDLNPMAPGPPQPAASVRVTNP
jgi:hypothetical protein